MKEYVRTELARDGGTLAIPMLPFSCTNLPMAYSGETLGSVISTFRLNVLNKVQDTDKFLAYALGSQLEKEVRSIARAMWIFLRPLKDSDIDVLVPAAGLVNRGTAYEQVTRGWIQDTISKLSRE